MSTKYKSDIEKRFDYILSFQSKEEQINHDAFMLHYRVMHLVEKAMDEKGWNKKQLALETGKSQSYITQLFMGHKMLNLTTMALFQEKLGLKFTIDTLAHDEKYYSFKYRKQKPSDNKNIKPESASRWITENKEITELAG